MLILSPEYTLYVKSFIGILAIVNPLGAIPIFLSISGHRTSIECRKIAQNSALSGAIILIITTWAGDSILGFFGISLPAFRAAGGLLIMLMALNMLHAKQSHTKATRNK